MKTLAAIIATVLLASVGARVAVAGVHKRDAAARMVMLAHWKASCGQGGWTCDGYGVQGPYGPADSDPEWTGAIIVIRHYKKSKSHETCHVDVALNKDGSTSHLSIDCEYGLGGTFHPAGDIGTAVHRKRRLAQWELGQAGLSLARQGR